MLLSHFSDPKFQFLVVQFLCSSCLARREPNLNFSSLFAKSVPKFAFLILLTREVQSDVTLLAASSCWSGKVPLLKRCLICSCEFLSVPQITAFWLWNPAVPYGAIGNFWHYSLTLVPIHWQCLMFYAACCAQASALLAAMLLACSPAGRRSMPLGEVCMPSLPTPSDLCGWCKSLRSCVINSHRRAFALTAVTVLSKETVLWGKHQQWQRK